MSNIYLTMEEDDGMVVSVAIEDAHKWKEFLKEPKIINFAMNVLDAWRGEDNYDR